MEKQTQKFIELPEHTVINEIGLTYRPNKDLKEYQITCPAEAVTFLRKVWNDMLEIKESFYVVLLNNAKKIVGYSMISLGGSTATIVDPKEILRIALVSPCCSMILAHNHPSGNTKESRADVSLTDKIAKIADIVGIPVDDHIIITRNNFMSMKSKGLV